MRVKQNTNVELIPCPSVDQGTFMSPQSGHPHALMIFRCLRCTLGSKMSATSSADHARIMRRSCAGAGDVTAPLEINVMRMFRYPPSKIAMYIYIYIYIFACVYKYIYIYIYTDVYSYTHVGEDVRKCATTYDIVLQRVISCILQGLRNNKSITSLPFRCSHDILPSSNVSPTMTMQ